MDNPTLEKAKGPTVAAVSPLKTGQSGCEFSPTSTHSEAQRRRIVAALRHRPQSTEDLRKLGIYQVAARIKELRDRFGYAITTDLVVLVDRAGFRHARCALYTLVSEVRTHGGSMSNQLAVLEGAASADTRPCLAAESERPYGVGADMERQ
ncbi:hypothetical protein LJR260_003515 [Variovorax paradoxus]|uniref:helix-turn-helix domain-containing protein n=1 Tax=Variovorax paradoxus TaxID=34073 RepID=UPI0033975423